MLVGEGEMLGGADVLEGGDVLVLVVGGEQGGFGAAMRGRGGFGRGELEWMLEIVSGVGGLSGNVQREVSVERR